MADNDWNASLYDSKLGFVSAYGTDLLGLLRPRPGERVVDVGCGTGDLASRIREAGADVLGLDASPAMVDSARRKYPDLDFRVARAESFRLEEPVDAAFSNATLHWVKDARGAADAMFRAVKPGGRLVVEFGGKGNVAAIVEAVSATLRDVGVDAAELNPWYFPSVGEYAALLESVGWEVAYAELYDRPTPLDGEDGLDAWLAVFAAPFFAPLDERQARDARRDIADRLRPALYDEASRVWTADYRRIRATATRPARRR